MLTNQLSVLVRADKFFSIGMRWECLQGSPLLKKQKFSQQEHFIGGQLEHARSTSSQRRAGPQACRQDFKHQWPLKISGGSERSANSSLTQRLHANQLTRELLRGQDSSEGLPCAAARRQHQLARLRQFLLCRHVIHLKFDWSGVPFCRSRVLKY